MASKGTLMGSYYIRGYLQGAVNRGLDPGEILAEAGLSPDLYEDAGALLNGRQMQDLIIAIRNVLNDHYLGFMQVPAKLAMDMESGRVAVKHKTLGEGIRGLAAFVNAVRSDEERDVVVDESTHQAAMFYRFEGFQPNVEPHLLYWFRLFWGYRFYCWLIGQRIKLSGVYFSGQRPPGGVDYEAVFHCPVHFGQSEDKYLFDAKYLVEPIIRTEVELFSGDYPNKYPDWFTLPGRDQSLSSQVEQIIIELMRQGMPSPSIDVLAGIMATSARTLARKLAREQETFQNIKAKVRSDTAKRLLLTSDLPIAQIAEQVGFAEPGDFTRAFTNWAGFTPSAYRTEYRGTLAADQRLAVSAATKQKVANL